jgi:hypothetical protein
MGFYDIIVGDAYRAVIDEEGAPEVRNSGFLWTSNFLRPQTSLCASSRQT